MKKVRGRISGSILIVFLLMVSFIGSFVYADDDFSRERQGRDITKDILTKFRVVEKEVSYTVDKNKVKVEIDFNDKNKEIEPGDFLLVNWSGQNDEKDKDKAFFKKSEAIKNKIEIYHKDYKDKHIADLCINDDNAMIVFTDTVKDMTNIEGHAEFILEAFYTSEKKGELSTQRWIKAGDFEKTITITKPASGNRACFYHKASRYENCGDNDYINWWINANNNGDELAEDISIIDIFQDGYEHNVENLNITVTNVATGEYTDYKSVEEFNKNLDSKIIYSQNGDKNFDIKLKRGEFKGKTFCLYYRTKVTANNQYEFGNYSKVTYRLKNEENQEEEKVTVARKDTFNAWAKGIKKGEVRIKKLLEGTNEPIEGVKFKLEKDGVEIGILTTDEKGEASKEGLEPGKYTLIEISAPAGIYCDTDPNEFEINEWEEEGKGVIIYNKLETIEKKIKFSKVKVNGSEELSGAELKVVKGESAEGEVVAEWKSGNKQKEITLPEGTYTMVETQAPEGYKVAENITFKVTHDGKLEIKNSSGNFEAREDSTVKMEDALEWTSLIPAKTKVQVKKVWKDYKGDEIKAPADKEVKVQLYKNGDPFGEIVTLNNNNNNGWSHTFENLPSYDFQNESEINYTVKEVGEEDRKITIDGKEYSVSVTGNMAEGYTITNKYIPIEKKIKFSKVEVNGSEELQGAELKVVKGESANGEVVEQWTSGTEQKEITLPEGTYTMVETQAPEGYKTAENITFRVTAEGKLEIKNSSGIYEVREDSTVKMEDALEWTSLIPAKTKVQVKKVWKDCKGEVIEAPADKVEVQLLKNGIETDKFVVLNKENKWQGEFTDLPTVDKVEDENTINYTVKEVGEEDRKITIDGKEYSVSVEKNAEGFVITNTMVEPKEDPKQEEPKEEEPKQETETSEETPEDSKEESDKETPVVPETSEEENSEKTVTDGKTETSGESNKREGSENNERTENTESPKEKPAVPETSDKTPATPVTPEATEETTATPEKPETTEEESEKPMIFEKIVVKSTPEEDDEEEDNPLENETSEEKKEPESTNKTDDKKSSEDKSPQTFVGSIYFNITVLAVSFLALMACKIRKAEK